MTKNIKIISQNEGLTCTEEMMSKNHASSLIVTDNNSQLSEIQAVTKRLRQNNIEPRGFVFNALQSRKGYGKYGNYNYEYK